MSDNVNEGAFTRNEIQPTTDKQPVTVWHCVNGDGLNNGLNGSITHSALYYKIITNRNYRVEYRAKFRYV